MKVGYICFFFKIYIDENIDFLEKYASDLSISTEFSGIYSYIFLLLKMISVITILLMKIIIIQQYHQLNLF